MKVLDIFRVRGSKLTPTKPAQAPAVQSPEVTLEDAQLFCGSFGLIVPEQELANMAFDDYYPIAFYSIGEFEKKTGCDFTSPYRELGRALKFRFYPDGQFIDYNSDDFVNLLLEYQRPLQALVYLIESPIQMFPSSIQRLALQKNKNGTLKDDLRASTRFGRAHTDGLETVLTTITKVCGKPELGYNPFLEEDAAIKPKPFIHSR